MRPYSMVNAPDQHPHELLLTLVPQAVGGIVSPRCISCGWATPSASGRGQRLLLDAGGA